LYHLPTVSTIVFQVGVYDPIPTPSLIFFFSLCAELVNATPLSPPVLFPPRLPSSLPTGPPVFFSPTRAFFPYPFAVPPFLFCFLCPTHSPRHFFFVCSPLNPFSPPPNFFRARYFSPVTFVLCSLLFCLPRMIPPRPRPFQAQCNQVLLRLKIVPRHWPLPSIFFSPQLCFLPRYFCINAPLHILLLQLPVTCVLRFLPAVFPTPSVPLLNLRDGLQSNFRQTCNVVLLVGLIHIFSLFPLTSSLVSFFSSFPLSFGEDCYLTNFLKAALYFSPFS